MSQGFDMSDCADVARHHCHEARRVHPIVAEISPIIRDVEYGGAHRLSQSPAGQASRSLLEGCTRVE